MHARLSAGALLALCAAATAAGGCALPGIWPGTNATPPAGTAAPAAKPLTLSYQTDSDRLNVAAGGAGSGVQLAAYVPGGPGQIPAVTRSKLSLRYPHPQGNPELAQAVLAVEPKGAASSGPLAVWERITGKASAAPAPLEVWTLDIPRRELEAIVAELQRGNFFQRSKVLDVKAFVATEIDGARFGKDYRQVAALDAMILRVRSQGRLVQAAALAGGPAGVVR